RVAADSCHRRHRVAHARNIRSTGADCLPGARLLCRGAHHRPAAVRRRHARYRAGRGLPHPWLDRLPTDHSGGPVLLPSSRRPVAASRLAAIERRAGAGDRAGLVVAAKSRPPLLGAELGPMELAIVLAAAARRHPELTARPALVPVAHLALCTAGHLAVARLDGLAAHLGALDVPGVAPDRHVLSG